MPEQPPAPEGEASDVADRFTEVVRAPGGPEGEPERWGGRVVIAAVAAAAFVAGAVSIGVIGGAVDDRREGALAAPSTSTTTTSTVATTTTRKPTTTTSRRPSRPRPTAAPRPRTPTWLVNGKFVKDAGNGRTYLVHEGRLHHVLNGISLLLLTRGQVPTDVPTVPHAEVAAQPGGEAIGIPGLGLPPKQRTDPVEWWDDTSTSVMYEALGGSAFEISVAGAQAVSRQLGRELDYEPADHAVVERARKTPLPDGMVVQAVPVPEEGTTHWSTKHLMIGGTAYPLDNHDVVRWLGYRIEDVRPITHQWLDSLPKGPTLKALSPP